MLKETNGFRLGAFSFYGANARELPIPDGMLHVYFEDDRSLESLCLREGDRSQTMWHYDEVNEDLENYGSSFIAAIEKLITNQNKEA